MKKIEFVEETMKIKTHFLEFVAIISVFLACFGYLAYKIDHQSERTDRLYEMFIELLKEERK